MTTVHTTSTSSGSSGAATSIARFGATEGSLADQGFLCQYRHKAPIALNNQAVSLLARGYNQEALVIFQDAIAVMRSVTAMMDPNHASTPAAIGKAAIHAALRRAEQRMVASTFGSTTSSGEPRPNLHVISSLDNPARVYNALTTCTDLSVAFPVTIDLMEGIDSGESHDSIKNTLAFESAIVLFNYGLAHECAAAAAAARGDAMTAANIRHRRVYRIFQMASAILHKVGQCHEETRGWNAAFSSSAMQLLLLRLVLMHARLDVSIALNLAQDYEVCSADMQYLLQMVEFQQRWLPSLDDSALAAAA